MSSYGFEMKPQHTLLVLLTPVTIAEINLFILKSCDKLRAHLLDYIDIALPVHESLLLSHGL